MSVRLTVVELICGKYTHVLAVLERSVEIREPGHLHRQVIGDVLELDETRSRHLTRFEIFLYLFAYSSPGSPGERGKGIE